MFKNQPTQLNQPTQSEETETHTTNLKILNKKFNIPADALDYFYDRKYFTMDNKITVKLTKENSWFPADKEIAKQLAKTWTKAIKNRNRLFSKANIHIMFDSNDRSIMFSFKTKQQIETNDDLNQSDTLLHLETEAEVEPEPEIKPETETEPELNTHVLYSESHKYIQMNNISELADQYAILNIEKLDNMSRSEHNLN